MFKLKLVILTAVLFTSFSFAQMDDSTSRKGMDTKDPHEGMHGDMKSSTSMQDDNDFHSIMKKMHTEMKASKLSGDTDKDFAHLMIHHHEGAIKLSDAYINKGQNQELKRMAEDVKEENRKEIKQLKQFSGDTKGTQTYGDNQGMQDTDEQDISQTERQDTDRETDIQDTDISEGTDLSRNQNDMDTSTSSSAAATGRSNLLEGIEDVSEDVNVADDMETNQMSGSIDKDFASVMIMHHRQSIKMSENYLSSSPSGKLKDMAQQIIDESRSDIQDFEKFSTK